MQDYTKLSDSQLAKLSKENDSRAIGELSLRYSGISYALASKFAKDSEECADLSQEGMLGFLSAVCTFSETGGASFYTYASNCIRNRIISVLRKSNSQKKAFDSLFLPLHELKEEKLDSETPEEQFISQKNARYIVSLIEEFLTEQEKKVLSLHLSGISYKDIGEKLNISSKAVDSTLQRGRKKLRERLRDY